MQTDVAAEDAPEPEPGVVTCANACKRADRCAEALVSEADCVALCEDDPDPAAYACCIQYSPGCNEVTKCVQGVGSCTVEGEPWLPLQPFDDCECGNANDAQFWKLHECKETGPGHPCPTSHVCYKPPNSEDSPFCTIDCSLDPGKCEEGTKCTSTPQSNYCKSL